MTTDFIEERSPKVVAVTDLINILQLDKAEFAELTKYLAIQCGFGHLNNLLTIDDLNSLNEFYELGEPEPQVLYTLEPSNDFANLLGDRIETKTGVLAQRDEEPFGGDGYDRYIENLITDLEDSPQVESDYTDDFA